MCRGLQYRQEFGDADIDLVHCLVYRLELTVDWALKAATNHFQAFVQKLYSLYSQFPKNSRELNEAAAIAETELINVTSIFTGHFVSSSFRVVRAIWRDFSDMGSFRTSVEHTKFGHLAPQLDAVNFIQDRALIKDVLRK